MLSAGNDIVALSEIDVARTNTKQFYSKILSEAEMALYEQLSAIIPFEYHIWLLWSVKESAYKYLKRIDPDLVFTPVRFEVQQLDIPVEYSIFNFDRREGTSAITGLIQFDDYQLYLRSMIYEELISSVVDSHESFEGVYSGVNHIHSTDNAIQSAEVRTFLIEELTKLTERSNLSIQKNAAGIPVVFESLKELSIPISFSHHGNYIAYSFNLKK